MTILRVKSPEVRSDLKPQHTTHTFTQSRESTHPRESVRLNGKQSDPDSHLYPDSDEVITGSPEEIYEICATILREPGGLIAIPTETVYGLAGNIHLDESILRIFKIKERPLDDPLIVHVHSFLYALRNLYNTNIVESFIVLYLARKFAPGPLTIVARRSQAVSALLTNGSDFIAVRCPNNQITLKLLEFSEIPLAAPSANKFGHISPTCPEHVKNEFPNENLHILDDGNCSIGIESTIIRVYSDDNDYYYHPGHTELHNTNPGHTQLHNTNPGNPNPGTNSVVDVFEMMLGLIECRYVDDKLGPGYRVSPYENYFGNFTNCTAKIELLRKGSITLRDLTVALNRFPNIQILDSTEVQNVEIVPDSSSSGSSPRITASPILTHSTSAKGISPILTHNTSAILSSSTSPTLTSSTSPILTHSTSAILINTKSCMEKVLNMPGRLMSHYAPVVPTYLIEIIETPVSNRAEHLKGTSKNSTVTGDLTYNLNFDYEEVNCSNIILIDIGNYFRKYSHLFCLYLPLGTEHTVVANKLYSALHRAESKGLSTSIQSGVGVQSGVSPQCTGVNTGVNVNKGVSVNTGVGVYSGVRSSVRRIIAINFGVEREELFSAVYDRVLKASAGKVIHLHHVKNAIKFLLY